MLELPETDLKQTVFYQEAFAEGQTEGHQEGRQEGEATLILRLLQRRYGAVPSTVVERVWGLSVSVLEALGDAILELQSVTDLEQWLEERSRE